MQKSASVDFYLCSPETCSPGEWGSAGGLCRAALACTRKLLEQEDPFDMPFLMSSRLCSGCGRCAQACPLGAITITSGM